MEEKSFRVKGNAFRGYLILFICSVWVCILKYFEYSEITLDSILLSGIISFLFFALLITPTVISAHKTGIDLMETSMIIISKTGNFSTKVEESIIPYNDIEYVSILWNFNSIHIKVKNDENKKWLEWLNDEDVYLLKKELEKKWVKVKISDFSWLSWKDHDTWNTI